MPQRSSAVKSSYAQIAWMSVHCCDNLVERDAPRNASFSTIEANFLAAIIQACPPHKLGIQRLMRGTPDSYPTWDRRWWTCLHLSPAKGFSILGAETECSRKNW